MLNINLLKKIGIAIVPSILCIVLFYLLVYNPQNGNYKQKIHDYKIINQAIVRENDSILAKMNDYQKDIDRMDEIIKSLYEENYMLQTALDSINTKLTNIKERYDKTRKHSNSYTSNDIQRYFAELQ